MLPSNVCFLCRHFLQQALTARRHAARLTGQAVSSGAAGVSSDFTLKAGALVEICKDTRALLALLERPDGKRNWFAKDVRYASLPVQIPIALHGLFSKVHEPCLRAWRHSSCRRGCNVPQQGVAFKLCDPLQGTQS